MQTHSKTLQLKSKNIYKQTINKNNNNNSINQNLSKKEKNTKTQTKRS